MDKTAKSSPTKTNLCDSPGVVKTICSRENWRTQEIIMRLGAANERRPYNATSSLIGWIHIQNGPWVLIGWMPGNITSPYDPGMPIGHNLAIKDCDHNSDELQHRQLRLLWLSINAGCLGWLNYHSLSLACTLGNIFHKLRDQLNSQN